MSGNASTIEGLERRFWKSMVDKDAMTAMRMIADDCLITGPMGSMRIDPDKYRKMTEEGDWALDSFSFSDVEVIEPAENMAIIAYKVMQKGTMHGKPMDMECADSSTWVREGGAWKCALHTETMLEH